MTRGRLQALAAILCGCALLSGCGNGGGEPARTLPDVTGLALAQAEQRLESAGVSWILEEQEGPGATTFDTARKSSGDANRALAKRRVIAQDPRAGVRVTSGDVILLTLRR